MDVLSTSGINSLITSYRSAEFKKRIYPLRTRVDKYDNLSSAYSNLSAKLSDLKNVLDDLKLTGSDSKFSQKTSTSSNDSFITSTATSSASTGTNSVRVNSLAHSDLVFSTTLGSDLANGITEGVHSFRVRSGVYETNIEVTAGTGETNATLMEKINDAVYGRTKAKVLSAEKTAAGAFTMDATNNTFDITVNDTTTTVTIDSSEWAGITDYNSLMDVLVSNINDQVDGVITEKVSDNTAGTVRLSIKSSNSSDLITLNSTGLDGSGNKISAGNLLMDDLGITAYNEKAATAVLNTSVFAPTSGESKISFTAVNSGYENRLIFESSELLNNLGLTSDVLSNRYKNSDDGTSVNNDKAGFAYGTKWLDVSLIEQGTAESTTNNNLDAEIEFNGISIRRDSNTISDLVTGVTFTLNNVMEAADEDVNITIANDVDAIKSDLEEFISKFNSAYFYIKDNMGISNDVRLPFTSNSYATSLLNTFNSFAYGEVAGITNQDINSLLEIGISFDINSGLSISSSSTLEDKLAGNLTDVEELFNSTSGIASSLYDALDPYLGTDGYLATSTESLANNSKYLDDRITSMETRIDKSASVLRKRYEGLQQQLISLMNMQNMFSQFTGGMF
ncbi:MAG: flagellar filament capping protein FliD [Melioribacteraceae bacterium]|nr:flagellar filament capping protein FliD [Melioribacteraceae bacterium]MCF8353752.1 flagellar filament capping protein FliD [Melioribacteraceae bacterium]MCF8392439.1 flagellar filament capping protein FliD [Melioribacteraceae bacterium]MCF8418350.1 flagellar filament capping protein FliD [Melioribacteraceae bacterium]